MQALLDSTGAFAVGAERLDSAALRLQRLIGTADDESPIDQDRIKSMMSELETSFEQFDLVGCYTAAVILALIAIGTLLLTNLTSPKEEY